MTAPAHVEPRRIAPGIHGGMEDLPAHAAYLPRATLKQKLFLGLSFRDYLKAQVTPFNIIAAMILAVGIPVTWVRFTQGLAATTNLTDTYPWGLWIGVDVLCGVALAAGGFTLGSAVYLFGMKEYHPIVRPAVLTGFLGYFFVIIGLAFDLGRPWRLPYPMFVSYGTTSVMFLVGWHVATYLSCQFVEFSPALFEWLGWKKWRKIAVSCTIGATIFGVILSTLHQSALGGLFLLTPGKLHPLWYTPYLPVFFLNSAIIGGISMVIFESLLSHRFFSKQIPGHEHKTFDHLTLGLGKAAAVALWGYFGLKVVGMAYGRHYELLLTGYGAWWTVEVAGFILGPCLLFVWAYRHRSPFWTRMAAVWTVLGIILNRVNVSMIAFNWKEAVRYYPKWTEYVVTVSIIVVGIITFRWIVNRMPILWEHPHYESELKRN